MGLGIHVSADVARSNFYWKKLEDEELFHLIAIACQTHAKSLKLDIFVDWTVEKGLCLKLHPAAEEAEFHLRGQSPRRHLICSARTSDAGPGYHAYVAFLLDKLREDFNLQWRPEPPTPKSGDAAAYFGRDDFGALQREMADHLRCYIREAVVKGKRRLAFCMPTTFEPVNVDFSAMSPLGFWDEDCLMGAAHSDDATLPGRAAKFYPWWSQEIDAVFWLNAALTRMWVDLPWRTPQDETEREEIRVVLKCLDRARHLDPDLALPELEIVELKALLKSAGPSVPAPNRIGFRRLPMRRKLIGRWSALIPGYFCDDVERADGAFSYQHDGKQILCGVRAVIPRDLIAAAGEVRAAAVIFEKEGVQGSATLERRLADGVHFLEGQIWAAGESCLLTIFFENPADLDWAKRTFESVERSR